MSKRIVLLGCQKLAIDVIDFIHSETDDELVGVVTHDEERDKMFCDKSVAQRCDELGIYNFRYPDGEKIDPARIEELKLDIIFSIYYRRIIPMSVLKIPSMECINLHPALLPKNRGPNPTYWTIRRGEWETGVTLHYIDKHMDTGDIIAQPELLCSATRLTGFMLNGFMMDVGLRLFKDNYQSIMLGKNSRTPQDHMQATYNMPFCNKMRYIDWSLRADQIDCHIRAHAPPYAGSIACNNDVEIIINGAEFAYRGRKFNGPGSYRIDGKRIIVDAYDGSVTIKDYKVIRGTLKKRGRFV